MNSFVSLFLLISFIFNCTFTAKSPHGCNHSSLCGDSVCEYPLENCSSCIQDCCFTCGINQLCDLSTQYCCNSRCIFKNQMCCSHPNKIITDTLYTTDTITISNMKTNNLTVYLNVTYTSSTNLLISLENNITQLLYFYRCHHPSPIIMNLTDTATHSYFSPPCNEIDNYYKPLEFLYEFNNVLLTNIWTLILRDPMGLNTGILDIWCLINI